tara:strand:+ start:3095 stop:3727 length:633 start_codon:yes stop_codon:yes gene_type:complete
VNPSKQLKKEINAELKGRCEEFSKIKDNPEKAQEAVSSFSCYIMKALEKGQGVLSPDQWRERVRLLNRWSEKLSQYPVEFENGWKLHKHWFKQVLAQITPDHRIHVRRVYNHFGWDYDKAFTAEWSETTTQYTVKYFEENTQTMREISILLEGLGLFSHGCIWKSTTGQQWNVAEELENTVLMETQNTHGVWIDREYNKDAIIRDWRKVS